MTPGEVTVTSTHAEPTGAEIRHPASPAVVIAGDGPAALDDPRRAALYGVVLVKRCCLVTQRTDYVRGTGILEGSTVRWEQQ